MIPEAAQAAQAALGHLDRLLAERPRETHEALSLAVRGVVGIRDALIARRRAGGDVEADLAEANKLVTTAISAQFPISDMQWDRVERMRDGLQAMLRVP